MERARRLNPSEIPLTSAHTPGLVADVDEDVISAVKRAKGQSRADDRSFHCILHDEDSLLELLAVDLAPVVGVDTDGAVLAEYSNREVKVRGASAQRRLRDIEQLGDILLVPGLHFVEEPLRAGDVGEAVRRGRVEAEEEVALAAHDDQAVFLGGGEGGGVMDGVEEALEALVVLCALGVAGGGDDADAHALVQEADDARDGGVVRGEAGAVVVEGDVSVEGDEVETGPADEAEELGGVEGEADVVEGGGDEATAADHAFCVLVFEGVFEREPAEERARGRDEEFQFGLARGGVAFMVDVVVDELLNIPEDLRVALMGVGCYGHEVLAMFLVDSGGLRVQHKGDRQKAFDPFNQLVSTMRLSERVSQAQPRWLSAYLESI